MRIISIATYIHLHYKFYFIFHRTLVEESEKKLMQEQKILKKDKKKLVKLNDNLKKVVEEMTKLLK